VRQRYKERERKGQTGTVFLERDIILHKFISCSILLEFSSWRDIFTEKCKSIVFLFVFIEKKYILTTKTCSVEVIFCLIISTQTLILINFESMDPFILTIKATIFIVIQNVTKINYMDKHDYIFSVYFGSRKD